MKVNYILCLTLLAALEVFCLPLAESGKPAKHSQPAKQSQSQTSQPTTEPPATSARPKRNDPESQCCGQTKRESSCCGLSDNKECCRADGSKECCGAESQTKSTKVKRQSDDTNKTCCGKDRISREANKAGGPSTTAPPEDSAKARPARQSNSSCCGSSGPLTAPDQQKTKRQARDCCGEAVELEPSPIKDQVKVRVLRALCCGLEGEEAKKCCGASQNPTVAPPSKSKRCDHSTTPHPGQN